MTQVNDVGGLNIANINTATATVENFDVKSQELFDVIENLDADIVVFSQDAQNLQTLKDQINSCISGESFKEKKAELEKILSEYESGVGKIEEQIAKAQAEIDSAKSYIERCENEIVTLTALRDEETKKVEEKEAQLEAYDAQYQEVAKNASGISEELNTITEEINTLTSQLENETKAKQEQVLWEALYNYDPEKDGDYGEYISERMNGIFPDSYTVSLISTLSSQSSQKMREVAGFQLELTRYEGLINGCKAEINDSNKIIMDCTSQISIFESEIATQNASIQQNTTLKTSLNEKIEQYPEQIEQIKKQISDYDYLIQQNFGTISDEEWKFVEEKNIDLSEKLSNGNPRYIIAPGDSDNNYHIYDMAKNGKTLVRQMAEKSGYDIIERGSGVMYDYKDKDFGDGKIVFTVEDSSSIKYDNACFRTASPLAFDLNGDGVKTSGTLINFDIDGDNEMDTIYNAADAILVFDADKDGIVGESGLEVFGDNTDLDGDGVKDGFKDGFEALKALAQNEGLINDEDRTLDANDLKILEEKHGLMMKTDGYLSEAKSLSELGISEISLAKTDETTLIDNFDGKGNQLMQQEGATFKINGVQREYADLWHVKVENNNSVPNVAKAVSPVQNATEVNLANMVKQNLEDAALSQANSELLMNDLNNRASEIMMRIKRNQVKVDKEQQIKEQQEEKAAKEAEAKEAEKQEQLKKEEELKKQEDNK